MKLNELYPPPGKPSTPPKWDDVVKMARDYPQARAVVILVERGEMTREQGLILLAFAFAEAFQRLFSEAVERRRNETPRYIVTPENR